MIKDVNIFSIALKGDDYKGKRVLYESPICPLMRTAKCPMVLSTKTELHILQLNL